MRGYDHIMPQFVVGRGCDRKEWPDKSSYSLLYRQGVRRAFLSTGKAVRYLLTEQADLPVHRGAENVVLVAKVVMHEAQSHVRRVRDVAKRRSVVAVLGKQDLRSIQNQLPRRS